jgi:hypothetical protein
MKSNTRVQLMTAARIAVVVLVACTVTAPPALAGEPQTGERPLMAMLQERIAAGDLEYRDPATNEVVVATHERVAALRFELERYFGQPEVVNLKVADDGTVGSVVGDAIRDVFLIRTNLDGTRTRACLRDLDAAVAFMVGLDTVESDAAAQPSPAVDW